MNAQLFVNILKWHLLVQAKVFHGNSWFLIEDNDPKHTSKLAKKWMTKNMPNKLLDWPSQSPDLNPIENLFAWMKHQLDRKRPKSIEALKSRIQELWDFLTPKFLEPYWKSMPRRCRMCVEEDGYFIKY